MFIPANFPSQQGQIYLPEENFYHFSYLVNISNRPINIGTLKLEICLQINIISHVFVNIKLKKVYLLWADNT